MKCCIIGAGATGGFLAVKLGLAGHAVSVVARGAALEAMRQDGIQLEQGGQTYQFRPHAVADGRELGVQDLIFVTTKATALASIAAYLPPLIGPQTRVLFLQNGMTWWYPVGLHACRHALPELREFSLARTFLGLMRPDQIVGGIVYTANAVVRPGLVRNNSPRHNAVEIAAVTAEGSTAVPPIRALLVEAGIGSDPVADLRHALWLKLIGNASASSLCVATGNPAAIVRDPAIQAAFLRMVEEGMAVAAAHGYVLDGQLDLSRWTQHRAAHKPSMLQDYEAGRPMEIEQMILAPVAFARAGGVATPTLDAVTAIVARLATDKGLYDPAAALAMG